MTQTPENRTHFYWHVLLLSSLIFTQPLFNALNSQPEFLLAHNLTGLSLLVWILAVSFFAGLIVVTLVYLLTRLLPVIARQIKTAAFFILTSLFVFIQINSLMPSNLAVVAIAAALFGLAFTWLYSKSALLRIMLAYFTFLVLLVPPLVFSLTPDIRQLLLPQQVLDSLSMEMPIDKHPVVVLVLDELPMMSLLDSEGNINQERFPNFASLAAQSTWYKYATTTANETLLAVPPILTGRALNSEERKLPLASNYPRNLFTVFSNTHKVNGFETFTQLCPVSLCNSTKPDWMMVVEDTLVILAHMSLPDQHKQNLPQIDNKWVGYLRGDDEEPNSHTDRDLHKHHRYKVRLDKLRRFVSELKTVDHTSLNYLHVLLPHSPWMYLPDGRVYSNAEHRSFTGTLPAGTVGLKHVQQLYDEQHLMDFAQQRHLLQLGYTDALLGEIFTVLRERGMFDDALILLMADHGVSFEPGESLREVTDWNHQDILSIPLFIKRPAQTEGRVDLRAARSLDVLPTLLDALNSELNGNDFDGRSLLQPPNEEEKTISIQRLGGKQDVYPFSQFKERFDHVVKNRKRSMTDGPFADIYAINAADLINRTVSDLPFGPQVNYSLHLDSPHLYEDIDLDTRLIPTLIRANRVYGNKGPEKARLAVSVNGVIRAVSILQKIDTLAFELQLLVDPESFQKGANTIAFHQLDLSGDSVSLSPVPMEDGRQLELLAEDSGELVLGLDTNQLVVGSDRSFGELMLIAGDNDDQVRLTGWAARTEDGLIADSIHFFANEKLIASAKPHLHYPLAEEFTGFEHALNSGFNLSLPLTTPASDDLNDFVAIAVFNTEIGPVAGELRYKNWATQFVETLSDRLKTAKPISGPLKPAVAFDQVYDFSDQDQAVLFIEAGWAETGNKRGRWNEEARASLNFVVENNENPLELIVEASPLFINGVPESHIIEAKFRSGATQMITLDQGQSNHEFKLAIAPKEIRPDGRVRIRLHFQNAVSPKSLGMNNDVRPLALNVKSFQVRLKGADTDKPWWRWD